MRVLLDKRIINGALIIAPLRPAKATWPAEKNKWAEFAGLDMVLLHGKDKDKLLAEKHQIYVINPEGLNWLFEPTYDKRSARVSARRMQMLMQKFDMLVIDESTKFKSYSSQRFRCIKATLNYWKRRYIMTGTPAPNGLEDLWAQIYILDGGASLSPYITHYRNAYFYTPPGGSEFDLKPFSGAEEKIAAKIDHLVMRLKAEDYLELPELTYNRITVDLPPKVMAKYKFLEAEFMLLLDQGIITVANSAVMSNKLRQLVSGAMYLPDGRADLHFTKAEALAELVEELSGQPLLVGYDFVFEKDMIKQHVPQAVFLDGKHDAEMIQMFNAGMLPVLCGNPASVGHGLNLQRNCAHVAFLSLTWNLENFEQFIKRVLRQGNNASRVVCHLIIGKGTVDETVWRVLQGKERTQKNLLNLLQLNAKSV